jgi:hypothetical protein
MWSDGADPRSAGPNQPLQATAKSSPRLIGTTLDPDLDAMT